MALEPWKQEIMDSKKRLAGMWQVAGGRCQWQLPGGISVMWLELRSASLRLRHQDPLELHWQLELQVLTYLGRYLATTSPG